MKFFLLNTAGSAEGRSPFLSNYPTLLFIMRVSFLYIVIMTGSLQLLLASNGSGQNLNDIKVTVELQNEKLETLFKTIQAQTGLLFTFFPEQVDAYTSISLPKATRSVKATLDLALGTTPLTYRQVNNNVIILKLGTGEEHGTGSAALINESTAKITRATITGTVTDGKMQQPMAGVNIIVKGTTRGTTSDTQGKFAIDADDKDVLVFSFIGFKTFEVQVSVLTVIDVTMEEDMNSLQEVVVNAGYYTTTDRMKTGNIVKITAKDIENQPITSPLMALQGRVPGLEVTPRSGTPGNAPIIRIRGQNSLRVDGGYPLYIVDGIPVNSSPIASNSSSLMSGGYDPISSIGPSNIESIEVLKDADATSIYGSRGANGVILITTKQSTRSTKTDLTISAYRGIGEVSNKLELLTTEQYLLMRNEAFSNDATTPNSTQYDINGSWDQTRYTDWQDVLLGGSAHITDIQGGISGGNKGTFFRLNGNFHKETLVFPGDFNYKRASGLFNLNHTSQNEKFKISLSMNYGTEKNKLFNGSFMTSALTLEPNAPALYNEDGSLNWALVSDGSNSWTNPLSIIRKSHNSGTGNLTTNSLLSYEVIPGLVFKTSVGYSELNGDESLKTPISSVAPSSISASTTASMDFGRNRRTSWILEPQVAYNREWEFHSLTVNAGTTWQESVTESQLIRGEGYTSDALLETIRGATTITFLRDDFSVYRYNAIFGRLGYSYKEKYLLNVTGRRDGSSRFGPGSRFGNFGAIAAAWIFSNENLFKKNSTFLSSGKLRASYGTTGNDQIGDYQFYNTYAISTGRYQNSTSLVPNAPLNPDFAWEVTKKLEVAIEFSLFKERTAFEISWYQNRSSNQLVNYQLPATTGFSSILSNLDATVQNSGWEATIRSENINSSSFRWITSLNLSIPKNKLVEFPGIEDSPYASKYKVGESLSIQRLYTSTGINQQTGLYQFLDFNDDGRINDTDKRFMSPRDRKYYGGLNNTLRYKSLELSFLFQFSNQTASKFLPTSPGRKANQPTSVLSRWQFEGQPTSTQKFSNSTAGVTAYINAIDSDFNNEDASFIRLKTLSISYLLPSHLLRKVKISESKLFLQGQNLFTVTDYLNLDPETGSSLPPLRMITLGTQVKF